jgi:ATP-dependent Clp protease ATP-binding subunit ClpA
MKLFGKKDPTIVRMDESKVPDEIQKLETELKAKVAGQDRAINQFVRVHETYMAGLQREQKPLGVFLFVGPTGSGKTHVVETFADIQKVNLIKVDCAEFQREHEIAKLIGAPPGYVGGEVIPIFSKQAVEVDVKKDPRYNVVLFDEIEKANVSFHQILLGIMDKAVVTTGKNEKIDFSNTIVVMTSNLGSSAINSLLSDNSSMGFIEKPVAQAVQAEDIYKVAKKAVKSFFSAEFFNRLDRMVVFQPLSDEVFKMILEMELKKVQDMVLKADKFVSVDVSERGKAFLLKEGTSRELGARELRRTIDRFLTTKLTRAFATKVAVAGDMIVADVEPGADKMVLDISKGAMEMPVVDNGNNKLVIEPRKVYTEPENPKARDPYQGVVDPEFCGRCGFRWYDKHNCADLVDSAFEKFRRDMRDRDRRRKP